MSIFSMDQQNFFFLQGFLFGQILQVFRQKLRIFMIFRSLFQLCSTR